MAVTAQVLVYAVLMWRRSYTAPPPTCCCEVLLLRRVTRVNGAASSRPAADTLSAALRLPMPAAVKIAAGVWRRGERGTTVRGRRRR